MNKRDTKQEGNTLNAHGWTLSVLPSPTTVRMEKGWAVLCSEKQSLFIDGVNVAKQYGLN